MWRICAPFICVSLSGGLSDKSTFIFSTIVVFLSYNTHTKDFSFFKCITSNVFFIQMFFFCVCFGSQSSLLRLSCVWSYVPYYTFWCGFPCLYERETKIIFYYVIMQHIFKARQVVKRKIIVKNTPFFDVHHFPFLERIMSLFDGRERGYQIFFKRRLFIPIWLSLKMGK